MHSVTTILGLNNTNKTAALPKNNRTYRRHRVKTIQCQMHLLNRIGDLFVNEKKTMTNPGRRVIIQISKRGSERKKKICKIFVAGR